MPNIDDDANLSPAGGSGGGGGGAVAFNYIFDTGTTSDPNARSARLNNATLASVTKVWVDGTAQDGSDVEEMCDEIPQVGSYLIIRSINDSTKFWLGTISTVTPAAGYTEYDVAFVDAGAGGLFDSGENITVGFDESAIGLNGEELEFVSDGAADTALNGGVKTSDAGAFNPLPGIESVSILSAADAVTQNAGGDYAIAIGSDVAAGGDGGVAIGSGWTTSAGATANVGGVAIGGCRNAGAPLGAKAGIVSVAVGSNADAIQAGQVSIGYTAGIGGAVNSFALGNSSVGVGTGSIGMGVSSSATGDYAMALGSVATTNGVGAIAIGGAATPGAAASATAAGAIAIGGDGGTDGATAEAVDCIAIGHDAHATTGAGAIAIGLSANATAAGAIQIGAGTNAVANQCQISSSVGLKIAATTTAASNTTGSLVVGGGMAVADIGQDSYMGGTFTFNGAAVVANGDFYLGNGASKNVYIAHNASSAAYVCSNASASLGFFKGSSATTKQTVTGSRGGNAALASLLTALAAYGLITDSSS